MLASVRHTTRRLFPAASFSTSASKRQDGVNKSLGDILTDQSKAPVGKQLTKTNYAAYRVFSPGQPLLPTDLVYKNALVKKKIYRRSPVAPPPSVTRQTDTFHQLDLDPRHFTSNASVLSNFVTEMGKIKGRDQTSLTLKSQRLVGRTIRRAKMMGIMPILSKGYQRYH